MMITEEFTPRDSQRTLTKINKCPQRPIGKIQRVNTVLGSLTQCMKPESYKRVEGE